MPKKKYKMSPKDMAMVVDRVMPMEGAWQRFMGRPEERGCWLVWGRSFSGKTRLVLALAKYIAEIGYKVAYLSLEEGNSVSMRKAFREACMESVNERLTLWVEMDVEDMKAELRKQRSPQVVVIDSLQYLGINYQGYKELKREFENKLFIFISHANEKKEPMGATAVRIRYDAMVKILVDGFRAKAFSRYGGGEVMTVWEYGALQNPEGESGLEKMEEI
ncbi:MAG: DNA repair protein RadA [Bacteroidales bacterium]|nr:DNA repair protein RadA [Bacteroidales bacterium]